MSKLEIEDVLKGISANTIPAVDLWALLLKHFGDDYFEKVLDELYGINEDRGLKSLSYLEAKLK